MAQSAAAKPAKPSSSKKPKTTYQPGDEIIRLMIFDEPDPENPRAYLDFAQEFDLFQRSYLDEGWATVVLDSIDSFELAARKCEQYILNPRTKGGERDPRKWFGGSTDKLEETLCMKFAHLRCNVDIITHIDSEKQSVHGHALQIPSSGPGRMKRNLVTYFPEIYRSYVERDKEGERVYLIQTHSDNQFSAETHIDAPDPCWPTYEEITRTAMHNGIWYPGKYIHILNYGDFGAGKSTLAATLPKPMKVYLFDPAGGKEQPYLNQGIPGPLETFELSRGINITYQSIFERVEA